MKKRILALFLSVALVIVLIPAVSVPVSAAPSSGNVVQQMGGPVSSKFSLNIDDIIKNYASSRAYEARFYPFGEGEGMPVFVGTAHRVKDISKTDAQIAYLDAMEKAGTDEYSLKQFLSYVKKYEATCQTSAEELRATIYDASKTALSAAGFVAGGTVGDVVGVVSLATGVTDNTESLLQNGVDANVIASIGFTLGDLAGLAGGILGVSALATVGSVAAIGGVGYTMFQKYMEHQEQWKDFANYLLGRRNLVEFFKYLDVELKEAMENTSGWDIQFNACEYVDENFDYDGFVTPMTFTLTARFMHGYVSEFEFGKVHNTNEDGWAGNIELYMKAELDNYQEGWESSEYCLISNEIALYEYAVGAIVTDKSFNVEEDLYYNSSLTCLNFPLKTNNMDESQAQIVFTGSLSSGTYMYWQGGKMKCSFAYHDEMKDPASGKSVTTKSWSGYDSVIITKSGVSREYRISDWLYGDEVPEIDEGTEVINYGDMYGFENAIKTKEAKLVIDLSKPLGGITDNPNGEFYCSTCGAGLAPNTPCPNCSAGK